MITLYTAPTGNGYRASIMLEETGLAYTVRKMDFKSGDFKDPAFLAVNPVGQIPAIHDNEGPDGKPFSLSESLAILQYLADKSGKLLPTTALERAEAGRWSAIVASGLQPNFGSVFFMRMLDAEAHAPMIAKCLSDIDRYFRVMETRLQASTYLAGETYTYVDVLAIPGIFQTLPAVKLTIDAYPAIQRWSELVLSRPAVQRGRKIPA